jgi:hypothetical protein
MTLQEAIEQNKKIKILAYSVSDSVEYRVKEVLNLIFQKYKKASLIPPVYTCIKELLINAVKANFKNIYFEGYSSKNKSENIIEYDLALKLFKLELSRENAKYLEKLARKFEMKAEVLLYMKDDTLHVVVVNPVEMTAREKNNVQHKLECARKYEDIAEYFLENVDDSDNVDEGAGLGIIMISMMLRNMGVAEDDFAIKSENNKTTASIKIPLI